MTMKESSDEVNPDVLTSGVASPMPQRKTATDYVALAIATCGVGYFPIAPGTMGSLVGVGVYLLLLRGTTNASLTLLDGSTFLRAWDDWGLSFLFICVLLLVIIGLSLIGIWAASRAERLFGRKDPGAVVIDEVVGQLITFAFVLPIFMGPIKLVVGFVLFRAFDIIKPYPIRKLEKLPSGLGIVVDDIAAGFYAGAALAIINALGMLHIIP
jgi:phosphatidylglycerophosphatase A